MRSSLRSLTSARAAPPIVLTVIAELRELARERASPGLLTALAREISARSEAVTSGAAGDERGDWRAAAAPTAGAGLRSTTSSTSPSSSPSSLGYIFGLKVPRHTYLHLSTVLGADTRPPL